jgi:hypothetical protein
MSLETPIDQNRRAIDAEPIKAIAVFSVRGDLVGLTGSIWWRTITR